MHDRPQFSLFRRLFFPYNGEEPLTRSQGLRVMFSWALFFSSALVLGTLPIVLFKMLAVQRVIAILLLVFLGGAIIFALMAWFVVVIVNRSAQIRQKWKEQSVAEPGGASGGRYGS